MSATFRSAFAIVALGMAAQASAQLTFYEHPGMRGASITIDRPVADLGRMGFRGVASSAVVAGETWEVCQGVGFTGRCDILPPGSHNALGSFNDAISSARPVGARGAHGPGYPPQPGYQPSYSGGQVTFYERRDFRGRSFTSSEPIGNFDRFGFNDRASSAVITGGSWEVCDDRGFRGRCAMLRPGQYPSLREMGLNNRISSARPAAGAGPSHSYEPGRGGGQVTMYEHTNFRGQSVTIDRPSHNLERFGFNNAASSIEVAGEPWEFCEGPGFGGRCVVLRPGRYPSLSGTGLNDTISSARPAHR